MSRHDHDSDGGAFGGGPADAIAVMQQATRRSFDNRPSGGIRQGAAGDIYSVNGKYQGSGQLAVFEYSPELLQVGYLNPVTTGPAPPLHNGLKQRVFVRQRFVGWPVNPPSSAPTYNTQPADGYSGRVPAPLQETGGHFTATVPASEAT